LLAVVGRLKVSTLLPYIDVPRHVDEADAGVAETRAGRRNSGGPFFDHRDHPGDDCFSAITDQPTC
jgi:hypothetical protein